MKWWRIDRTFRNLRRTRQILAVLFKYGFGSLVEGLIPVAGLTRGFRLRRQEVVRLTPGERLRLALEELGPTFVKLGQLLSTRPDILPADIHRELQKLQDAVPPVPFGAVRETVERDLKAPLGRLFASLEETPTASASVAQVHRAVLPGGEVVAVKVLRPGISRVIEDDLEILSLLVGMVERRSTEVQAFRPHEVLEEFRRYIRRELDLTYEAYTMTRMAENLQDDPGILIPRVHWERTSFSVLTMDWVEGIPLSRVERLREEGHDLPGLARLGAQGVLRQVFVHGLFHGDPHPGNVLVTADGRLGLLDFGMVGRLSDTFRDLLADLLVGVVEPDAELLARAVLDLAVEDTSEVNPIALREDLSDFIGCYWGVPLQHLSAPRVLADAFAILRRHRVAIPPQLTLLVKVLVQAEGVGRALDPHFSIVEEARPFVTRLVKEKASPGRLLKDGVKVLGDTRLLLKRLPADLGDVLRKLRGGRLRVELEHQGLPRLLREMDRVSNRLSFAVILAAIIVGSSLILTIERGPRILDLPLLGLIGFVIAAGVGLWLVVDILRSGRY